MSSVIEDMLANRRLERVQPNGAHAHYVIRMAQQHLETARLLAQAADLSMAFTAAYDGARKVLSAVLSVEGLRVRPIGGAHRNTGIAAAVFVDDASLSEFDWMRQVRNATEYPDPSRPPATSQDLSEAIESAGTIVDACATYVAHTTSA